jgi:dihydroxy-acid dehydratase
LTKKAFENAITLVNVLGGSTNAVSNSYKSKSRLTYMQVLHLLAMARAAEVPLEIDEFQPIADRTPYLADLRPSGKYMMEDLNQVGGVPAVLK